MFDQPGINLLAAAAPVTEISQRLSKGQEIGSIFVTAPQMSEYQYYQAARKEREAKEADKAVKEYAAQAKAKPRRPTLRRVRRPGTDSAAPMKVMCR